MPILSTLLPDHILRRMSAADRKQLGAAGITADEALARAAARTERELQDLIAALLRLRGIDYCQPSPVKKSGITIGWPDFTFCHHGVPIVLEVKTATGTLRPEQAALHPRLAAQGWRVHVVRTVAEVKAILDAIDLAKRSVAVAKAILNTSTPAT